MYKSAFHQEAKRDSQEQEATSNIARQLSNNFSLSRLISQKLDQINRLASVNQIVNLQHPKFSLQPRHKNSSVQTGGSDMDMHKIENFLDHDNQAYLNEHQSNQSYCMDDQRIDQQMGELNQQVKSEQGEEKKDYVTKDFRLDQQVASLNGQIKQEQTQRRQHNNIHYGYQSPGTVYESADNKASVLQEPVPQVLTSDPVLSRKIYHNDSNMSSQISFHNSPNLRTQPHLINSYQAANLSPYQQYQQFVNNEQANEQQKMLYQNLQSQQRMPQYDQYTSATQPQQTNAAQNYQQGYRNLDQVGGGPSFFYQKSQQPRKHIIPPSHTGPYQSNQNPQLQSLNHKLQNAGQEQMMHGNLQSSDCMRLNNKLDGRNLYLRMKFSKQAREHRCKAMQSYKRKKDKRKYNKVVRYKLRKINAENRPRIKGRFVKKDDGQSPQTSLQHSNPDEKKHIKGTNVRKQNCQRLQRASSQINHNMGATGPLGGYKAQNDLVNL